MWLEGTDKLEECPRVLVKTYPPPVRLTWTDTAESESACQNLPSTCSPDLNWQSTVWECLSKLNLHLFAWLELTEHSLRVFVRTYPPHVRLTWTDWAESESACQNLRSVHSPDGFEGVLPVPEDDEGEARLGASRPQVQDITESPKLLSQFSNGSSRCQTSHMHPGTHPYPGIILSRLTDHTVTSAFGTRGSLARRAGGRGGAWTWAWRTPHCAVRERSLIN